jgi:hypothetical protein
MLKKRIASLFSRLRDSRSENQKVGMAWYPEDKWPLLRTVSADANQLEKTYGEWLKVAQARFDALVEKGTRVEKVNVDVEDMAAWCREMGRPVDGAGRAAYVVYRLQQQKAASSRVNINRG